MTRKKKFHDDHENHERWLVSYADFITLLFAFFVVMYAISSVNEGKYRVLSDSLVSAFKNTQTQSSGKPIVVIQGTPIQPPAPLPIPAITPDQRLEEEKKAKTKQKMKTVAGDITKVLQPLITEGKVKLIETSRGVTIEINDSVLFPPGQAKLQAVSITALSALAQVIASSDFPITIEGHTDNTPIATVQFPSNWELSAMRATTVLRLFNDAGVSAERLTAIGYGETRPLETNTTIEGRSRNRRVSILIDSNRPEEGKDITE
ncbi:flagellar motor protein MotD [Dechloromonas sp. ZY10]|uniref:flagellar motor protein MotD n=1 Tax=Dechloromonas aquae TaxID=2664436 RepID=UPI0035285C11